MDAPTLRRVLVATDFSDCSRAAIDYAALIARQFAATLEILYVSCVPDVLAGDAAFLGAAFEDADVIAGRGALDRLVGELARGGTACTSRVRTGFADEVLVDEANSGKYDLLVMGTHGRTGFKRLCLGSVATQVVRRAHIPVVTVPAWSAERARAADPSPRSPERASAR